MNEATTLELGQLQARDWLERLKPYREIKLERSLWELAVTAVPLAVLWLLAWASLSVSVWLTLALNIVAGGFLTRLFMIQHDCGHGTFFRRRAYNDWLGRALGVLTLTPYDVWQRSHAVHHATSGNLDRRGTGDIHTLTVREFSALSSYARFRYRFYRHPLVMFGLGPAYVFLLQNRLPFGYFRDGWQYWVSAMATNAGIAATFVLIVWLAGVDALLWVHLPIVLIAATIGVWLFYVQHQFEETHWRANNDWNVHEAALAGSSYFQLPHALRWLTANIGMHHVHHLCSRIPFYRLPDVLRDYPELCEVKTITLADSLRCTRFKLWDEETERLITFDAFDRKAASRDVVKR